MKLTLSAGIVVLAGAIGFLSSRLTGDSNQIIFLRVGQGDATIIRSSGRTVLIDTGPTSEAIDAGERFVVPALRKGSGRLDLIILTHPDLDHVGGTAAVLRAFPGTPIAVNAWFRPDAEFNRRLNEWKVSPDQIRWLNQPATIAMGDSKVTVIPPPSVGEDDNVGSLLLKVEMGKQSAVFTGDAPEETEAWAIGRFDWRADLYKAGHHGSATSSTEPWLTEVSPKIAVVSCGRGNRYGHPAKEVLSRFEQRNINVRRTDQEGDICLQPTHSGWVDCR